MVEQGFVGRHEFETIALDPRIPEILCDTGRYQMVILNHRKPDA